MSYQHFSDNERAILDMIERFVNERVLPNVRHHEDSQTYPAELVAEMKDLGLYGIAVPEEFGGLGLSMPMLAAVFDVFSRGWTTLSAYINSHSTVAYAIATYGTPEQKAKYLPGLATGEHRGALCLTEPSGGSDLQALRGLAKDAGENYAVTASKIYVTNGERATVYLTLVKFEAQPGDVKPRFGLILVERGYEGVNQTSTFHKTAFELVDTVQIEMDNVLAPKTQLLGGVEGKGFAQLMEALEIGRLAIAASAVGLATNALSEAKRYASERVAFGVAIEKHQNIQLKMANMATSLVTARLLVQEAARLKEAGGRCDMITAMAKLYASDAGQQIAQNALVVHGGAGYIREYAVERLNREALLYTIGEGANDINRLVIARRLAGDDESRYLGLQA